MAIYLVGPTRTYANGTDAIAAIAAISTNLSGRGVHEIIIDAGAYTGTLDTSGFTNPSATDYIYIHAAAGAEHKMNLAAGVLINGNLTECPYTITANLIFKTSSGGQIAASVAHSLHINVFFWVTGSIPAVVISSSADITATFITCFAFYDFATPSIAFGFENYGQFYGCGAYNFLFGFRYAGGSTVKNCYAWHASGGGGFWDLGGGSSDTANNASADTTAPGAGSLHSLLISDFGFVDAAGKNFHLQATSLLVGAGISLPAVYTTDIDLETITRWCIGPDFAPVPAVTLISPADNAIGQSLTPAFSWSAAAGATSYEIQIALDAAFTMLVVDLSVTPTSISLATEVETMGYPLRLNAAYYWRARAFTGSYSGAWSNSRAFSTENPDFGFRLIADHVARGKTLILHQFQENFG